MNRFLLLALTAGLLSPVAAKAESVWLVLTKHDAMEKIQMRDMIWKSAKKIERDGKRYMVCRLSALKRSKTSISSIGSFVS